MFKPLGSGEDSEVLERRNRERELLAKIENLERENGILRRKLEELSSKLQSEVSEREKRAFEEGLKRGREEVLKNLEGLLDKLKKITEEVRTSSDETFKKVRDLIIEIVFEIVNKLLPEIRNDSLNAALTSVREIVSNFLTSSPEVKLVYMNPDDLKKLEKLIKEQPELRSFADRFQLVFEPDPNLSPGDIVVKTEAIDIDGKLKTKLEELKNYLRENFNV